MMEYDFQSFHIILFPMYSFHQKLCDTNKQRSVAHKQETPTITHSIETSPKEAQMWNLLEKDLKQLL